jgi:ubiquinone/menaquinone biosynthesis C-methylase UbiE
MTNHTQRFTGRVENYIKYRPSYPLELVNLLKNEVGLSPDQVIADIGSGTGILSKIFLDVGASVVGVEPNHEMREAAERLLGDYEKFRSVSASAEDTTLGDQSVDLITAAQAFHWFDPVKAQIEFKRILGKMGSVVLVWNSDQVGSNFWRDYESFLLKYGTDYKELKEKGTEEECKIQNFFCGKFTLKVLKNFQELDFEGFKGRFLSISHAPLPSHAGYSSALQGLHELFQRHQCNGRLRMEYDTKIYFGRPGG